jgi:hypothetical protein
MQLRGGLAGAQRVGLLGEGAREGGGLDDPLRLLQRGQLPLAVEDGHGPLRHAGHLAAERTELGAPVEQLGQRPVHGQAVAEDVGLAGEGQIRDQPVEDAQDRKTDPATLYELASDSSALVRAAVAARPDAPAEALRPLARDRDRTVRQAVAKNPATSRGNLLRLLGDADRWVRWAVAANPAVDARVRQVMVKAQDKELRGLLAEMPALEPDLAAILVADASPEVRERLASHTDDLDVISTLLQDRTVRVRKGLAINARTTAEQRHILAQDSSPDVRAALVRAVPLDEADLQAMLDDRSVEVRRSMATSAVTPQHIRQALEDDADETVAEDARRYSGSPAAAAPAAVARDGHRRTLGKRFPGKTAR